MPDREKIREQLSAYIDGELSASETENVERALKQDAELAGELEHMRALRKLLHDIPRQQAPDDFASRVTEQAERMRLIHLHPHGEATDDRWRWVRYVATAAVLIVAVGIGTVIAFTLLGPRPPKKDISFETARQEPTKELRYHDEKNLGIAEHKDRDISDKSAYAEGRVKKNSVASGAHAPMLGWELAAAAQPSEGYSDSFSASHTEVVIYTDRMEETDRDVQRAFVSNGVAPVAAVKGISAGAASSQNYYAANKMTPSQIEYVAYIPQEQAEQLSNDLLAVQRKQRVSQKVIVGTKLELAKKANEHLGRDPVGSLPAENVSTKTTDEAAEKDISAEVAFSKVIRQDEPDDKFGLFEKESASTTAPALDMLRGRGAQSAPALLPSAVASPTTQQRQQGMLRLAVILNRYQPEKLEAEMN